MPPTPPNTPRSPPGPPGIGSCVTRLAFDALWRSYTWRQPLPPARTAGSEEFEEIVQLQLLPRSPGSTPATYLLGLSPRGAVAVWDMDRCGGVGKPGSQGGEHKRLPVPREHEQDQCIAMRRHDWTRLLYAACLRAIHDSRPTRTCTLRFPSPGMSCSRLLSPPATGASSGSAPCPAREGTGMARPRRTPRSSTSCSVLRHRRQAGPVRGAPKRQRCHASSPSVMGNSCGDRSSRCIPARSGDGGLGGCAV